MTELKGCPLCGSAMMTVHVSPTRTVYIKCESCPMQIAFDPKLEYKMVGEWLDKAIEAWNRRPDALGAVERDSIRIADEQSNQAGDDEDEP